MATIFRHFFLLFSSIRTILSYTLYFHFGFPYGSSWRPCPVPTKFGAQVNRSLT